MIYYIAWENFPFFCDDFSPGEFNKMKIYIYISMAFLFVCLQQQRHQQTQTENSIFRIFSPTFPCIFFPSFLLYRVVCFPIFPTNKGGVKRERERIYVKRLRTFRGLKGTTILMMKFLQLEKIIN